MGEEWRKGWHPERVPARTADDEFLIVGAGPTGLECARILGQRGYRVALTDAGEEFGGRVSREARLPGLGAWGRVRDYRVQQLRKMPNVELFRGSRVTADDVLEFGARRVVLATGAHWRRDGVARANLRPIAGFERELVLTPDDLMSGARPLSPVVLFDDDHYYLGAILAAQLCAEGFHVTLVTPAERVSAWTVNTLEQFRVQRELIEQGVTIATTRNVLEFDGESVRLACTYSGRESRLPAASLVTVTSRTPDAALAAAITARADAVAAAGIVSVAVLGDALAPSTIAAAVYAGHRYAREFDLPASDAVGFRRELPDAR
jgi:dimethylamine/trimethylamine dehydrogenase